MYLHDFKVFCIFKRESITFLKCSYTKTFIVWFSSVCIVILIKSNFELLVKINLTPKIVRNICFLLVYFLTIS